MRFLKTSNMWGRRGVARLLNRPQRKRLPYLKAGISVVEKIKLTVYMCRGRVCFL
jgi:hypothetical protein